MPWQGQFMPRQLCFRKINWRSKHNISGENVDFKNSDASEVTHIWGETVNSGISVATGILTMWGNLAMRPAVGPSLSFVLVRLNRMSGHITKPCLKIITIDLEPAVQILKFSNLKCGHHFEKTKQLSLLVDGHHVQLVDFCWIVEKSLKNSLKNCFK